MTELLLTSEQIGQLVAQFFIAGAGTLSFAVLFASPKRTLPYCGLVGAMGWFIYELAVLFGLESFAASLLAVIPLTLLARIFAIVLKAPVTIFLLAGIFPLVPGAGIYYTAYYFIQGNNALALANGISTFKIAVALAIGIALVLGLPLPRFKSPRNEQKPLRHNAGAFLFIRRAAAAVRRLPCSAGRTPSGRSHCN